MPKKNKHISSLTSDGKTPPKILIAANLLSFIQSHRWEIVKGAASEGYEVVLSCHVDVPLDFIGDLPVRVISTPNTRGKSINLRDIRFIFQFLYICISEKPNLLLLVTPKMVLYGGLISLLLRIPTTLFAFSGLGNTFIATGLPARIKRFIIAHWYALVLKNKNTVSIFQNKSDEQFISKLANRSDFRSMLLYGSGVSLEKFHPPKHPQQDKQPLKVIFAGRLIIEKGIGDLCEAARLIKARNLDVTIKIFGDFDLYNNPEIAKKCISDAEAGGLIIRNAHTNDINKVLRTADVFCFPSYYGEGLAKVLLEAAATGLPIITTDHPGCREAVEHGVSGLLVPIKDPEAIADAIEQIATDKAMRLSMASKSRDRAIELFSVTDVVDAHLKQFRILTQRS